MSDEQTRPGVVEALGGRVLAAVRYGGGMTLLLGSALTWGVRGLRGSGRRAGRGALADQILRLGVGSLPIVMLVQFFIGLILVLQITPPLAQLSQEGRVASIIGFAGFRMLGPIITAVVLSGFAGASIAAELGTMVVAEEIEALEASAVNPVRFLVVPRVAGTLLVTVLLTVGGDLVICLGGYVAGLAMGPSVHVGFWKGIQDFIHYRDFFTGLTQAAVFGLLIGLIACHEGLRVKGGAEGVGRAATLTVVNSIVAIIVSSGLFTVLFYVFEV